MTFSLRSAKLPAAAFLLFASAHMAGCGSEEEDAPAPAPVVSAPRWSLQDITMDIKVQFPEKYTPSSESLAQAIADFASAMARGDQSAFASMLGTEDRYFLQEYLVPSGEWASSTEAIRAVRIVNLEEGGVARVAIAVGTESEAYLTAWEVPQSGTDEWQFSAMSVAPRTTSRVALLDDASFDPDALWSSANGPSEEEDTEGEEDLDNPAEDDFTPPPSGPTPPARPATPFG